mmetsp:Transcript_101674/g.283038  ORF Transcript_101674/g.283038 Transcript_101674/m.283038 type:complete len:231 (-) Transcript_101674:58-750(-)
MRMTDGLLEVTGQCCFAFSSESSFCSASICAFWLAICRSSWRCWSWMARSDKLGPAGGTGTGTTGGPKSPKGGTSKGGPSNGGASMGPTPMETLGPLEMRGPARENAWDRIAGARVPRPRRPKPPMRPPLRAASASLAGTSATRSAAQRASATRQVPAAAAAWGASSGTPAAWAGCIACFMCLYMDWSHLGNGGCTKAQSASTIAARRALHGRAQRPAKNFMKPLQLKYS